MVISRPCLRLLLFAQNAQPLPLLLPRHRARSKVYPYPPHGHRHWHLLIDDYATLCHMMDTTLPSTTVVGTLTCVNFGPVTSIYTPQTSCYSTTSFILQNFNIYTESDCLPYGVLDYTTRFQYYSPGICPSGYNSAGSVPNLPTATTASFCCPS